MVNYRDKYDIIADILNVASREAKKTQIMYQANLSYKVLQRYLNEVIDSALVIFREDAQIYTLTSKGQAYLDAYKEYSKTNRQMEKRLSDISSKKRVLQELYSNDPNPLLE